MPPDFALVLGGMTVFNPVCGSPARWRTRSSSRRTSPHGTARATTFPRPPNLNCQHCSRSDEFDTRNFFQPGLPGGAKMSCQFIFLFKSNIQTQGQVSKRSYFAIWHFWKSYCWLTRAPLALQIFHHLLEGGGVWTPSISAPIGRREKRKKRSKAR